MGSSRTILENIGHLDLIHLDEVMLIEDASFDIGGEESAGKTFDFQAVGLEFNLD